MLQITPHMRILVAVEPADFRRGIDSLARLCGNPSGRTPSAAPCLSSAIAGHGAEGARVRRPGFWLCHKRLSQGRFPWWPSASEKGAGRLAAHQTGGPARGGRPDAHRCSCRLAAGRAACLIDLTSPHVPSLRPEFALVGLLDHCLTDARSRGKTRQSRLQGRGGCRRLAPSIGCCRMRHAPEIIEVDRRPSGGRPAAASSNRSTSRLAVGACGVHGVRLRGRPGRR